MKSKPVTADAARSAVSSRPGQPGQDLVKGNRCLVAVMGQRFMVDLLEVDDKTIRVSFPGRDYPISGMAVELEFHDPNGFNCYESEVILGPEKGTPGIVLERPVEPRRAQHRVSCRVPTDLTVQVKDQAHIRRYDAPLVNLSADGALIETNAPFDFSTTVELWLSLPGEPTHETLGAVVHISSPTETRASGKDTTIYGIRFLHLDPAASQSICNYIWERLRELYGAP